ncbi:MAG: exodeoxyribonuclease VII small subunit [Planctomycetota bacterium]
MNREKSEISYAEAMKELEKIVEDIKNENISIDELTEKIKKATSLIKLCKEKLRDTEKNINEILKEMGDNQNT